MVKNKPEIITLLLIILIIIVSALCFGIIRFWVIDLYKRMYILIQNQKTILEILKFLLNSGKITL